MCVCEWPLLIVREMAKNGFCWENDYSIIVAKTKTKGKVTIMRFTTILFVGKNHEMKGKSRMIYLLQLVATKIYSPVSLIHFQWRIIDLLHSSTPSYIATTFAFVGTSINYYTNIYSSLSFLRGGPIAITKVLSRYVWFNFTTQSFDIQFLICL